MQEVSSNHFNQYSFLMRLMLGLGFTRLAWSLRRLHCPVKPGDLVLEVGSGGNPYYRSNVLLDAFESTRQRHWAPLVSDRPTILGAVERLPFRDQSFDFVIASHVLEHSAYPEIFLKELQRVAKSGYIEVPDALMERLNPYRDHRLEITVRGSRLLIWKKYSWCTHPDLVELFESRAKKWISGETIPYHPFDFHVRYYWRGSIDFTVLNPEVSADWNAPTYVKLDRDMGSNGLRARTHTFLLQFARRFLSQRHRNAQIDLANLLACPECRSYNLEIGLNRIICPSCLTEFQVQNGLPILFAKKR